MPLVLASQSPRRLELLRQIGVSVEVYPAHVDEAPLPGEAPTDLAMRLAMQKYAAVKGEVERSIIIIAADTVVALDGLCYGKPRDEAEAIATLGALSGRRHQVHTAVVAGQGNAPLAVLSSSEVEMRSVTWEEAQAYWRTGEPQGKAGAYAIQGMGAVFIKSLTGSYSGVMGLPLFETAALLKKLGVSLP